MTPTRTGEGLGTLVWEPMVVDVAVVLVVVDPFPFPTTVEPITLVPAVGCVGRTVGTVLPPPQLVSVTMVVVEWNVIRVEMLVVVTVAVRPPDPTVVVTVTVLTLPLPAVTVDVTGGAVTVTVRSLPPPPPTVNVVEAVSHRVAVTVIRVAQTETVTVDGSTSDGAGHVTVPRPQAPNATWHSAPQYASSFPQYPWAEQQRPQTDPSHVMPLPQLPSVLISSPAWFASGGDTFPAATAVATCPRPRRQARTAARGRGISELSISG